MVGVKQLAGVVGPLGLLTGVMGMLNYKHKRSVANSHPMISEAVKRLQTNPSASMVLGEPISVKQIDWTRHDHNHFGDTQGHFRFTASGPKGKGTLRAQVIHLSEDQTPPWKIQRLELKIHHTSELERKEYANKLLLLYHDDPK